LTILAGISSEDLTFLQTRCFPPGKTLTMPNLEQSDHIFYNILREF